MVRTAFHRLCDYSERSSGTLILKDCAIVPHKPMTRERDYEFHNDLSVTSFDCLILLDMSPGLGSRDRRIKQRS